MKRELTEADVERLVSLIAEMLDSHDEMLKAHREMMETASGALAFAAQMAAERDAAVQAADEVLATTRLYADLLMLPTTGRKPS